MILLLAPLAAVPDGEPLAHGRRARARRDHGRRRPPGLRGDPAGEARRARDGPEQDLSGEPTVDAPRGHGPRRRPRLRGPAIRQRVRRRLRPGGSRASRESLAAGRPLETAIVAAHLNVLAAVARYPDRPQARAGRGRRGVPARGGGPRRGVAGSRGRGPTLRRIRPLAAGRGARAEPGDDGRPRRGGLVRRPSRGDHRLTDRQGGLGAGPRTSRRSGRADPAVVEGRPDEGGRDPEVGQGEKVVLARDPAADRDLDPGRTADQVADERRACRRPAPSRPAPSRGSGRDGARLPAPRRSEPAGSRDRHDDPARRPGGRP